MLGARRHAISVLIGGILLVVVGTLGGVAIAQTSGWEKPGDEVNTLQDAQAAINFWQLLPVSDDPSQERMWVAFGQMVDNMMEMDIRVGRGNLVNRFAPIGTVGSGTLTGCSTDQIIQWNGTEWVCSTALADLQTRVAALEAKLVGVDRGTTTGGYDTLFFTGMNLQVMNGTGSTDGTPNGLGNVVIGYNADGGEDDDRSGSHYIVVGDEHTYTAFGGAVFGYDHWASGQWASVTGGRSNTASGDKASVTGGRTNIASGEEASVTGGWNNVANDVRATVAGGQENTASGTESTVSGGALNEASGNNSSVSGGVSCTETGTNAWAVGATTGTTCLIGN